MKVSYPLSLKVSLWLLLNFLLLSVAIVGFFVLQGGVSWNALLSGRTGVRMQARFDAVARELAETDANARAELALKHRTAYRAEFFLVRLSDFRASPRTTAFPADVDREIELALPPGRGPFGREFRPPGEGSRGEPGRPPPEDGRRASRDGGPRLDESSAKARHESPSVHVTPLDPNRARNLSRFIVRAGSPAAFWVGMRVPAPTERGRPMPAILVARLDSFRGLLRFLELESWILAGSGVFALSVLFWLPLVRSITRSLSQLTTVTERIAEGRFDARISTQRRDELGVLGHSVNRMAAQLDAHLTGQKRFLGDVSHELCSPLARLQLATGILAERAPRELQATVADVREEVQQMSALVNELLAFTKAGLQARDVALESLALAPLVKEAIAREDAAGRVVVIVGEEVRVKASRDFLVRAIANLIRNALRYSDEASPVTVAACSEHARVVLTVDDEGPGVAVADLDRLGEPFFRPEVARTRESGGVGLGLAIVRSSVAACGGQVRFANRDPRGFRAEIHLDVAE